MKTMLLTLTVAIVSLSSSTPASAGSCRNGQCGPQTYRQHYTPRYQAPYQPRHVRPVYHAPQRHRQIVVLPHTAKCFSHRCELPKYGCQGFYCPGKQTWFYLCPQKRCYVPVKYIDQLPPVNANLNANANRNDNRNANDNLNQNNNRNVTNINIAAPQGAGPVTPINAGPVKNPNGDLVLALPAP